MSEVLPDALRAERSNVSVLKVDLARLRERDRCRIVIVLEGVDDLPVYEAWFKRLDDSLEWEPLVAKGKSRSLEFRRLLERDKTGIGVCTFFVVDHDYDGLRGDGVSSNIYVLPSYSIENYLAHESLLESYLRVELRVVCDIDVRQRLRDTFLESRAAFIRLVRPMCERLHGARNESCGNVVIRDVGSGVLSMVNSGLVVSGDGWLDQLVQIERPVSPEALQAASVFFDDRDEPSWIRGKFMLDFFKKFCEIIYRDMVSTAPVFFERTASTKALAVAGLDIRTLASRSPLPEGLAESLRQWKEICRAECRG